MLCNEEDQPNIIFAFNLKIQLIELVHLKLIISLGDNNGRLDICTQIDKCIFFLCIKPALLQALVTNRLALLPNLISIYSMQM